MSNADLVREVSSLIDMYGALSGPHGPVYTVLCSALHNRRWGVGEAQTEAMLTDIVSRRWVSDVEMQLFQAMWSLFNRLRRDTGQPKMHWVYGGWTEVGREDPQYPGPWIIVET